MAGDDNNIGSHRLLNRPSIVDTKNLDVGALKDNHIADHLENEENEVVVGQKSKILSYMSQSSMFIFHQESIIRKFMIQLTTAPILK